MNLQRHSRGVIDVSSDQLRAFANNSAERDYLMIDVRENGEYQSEHIPGAKHVPLSELEGHIEELRALPEALDKFVYCRSGGRSSRAAGFMAHQLSLSNVYNLAGGIMGYNGKTIPDLPRLAPFDGAASTPEILKRAMDLEKGADRLYESLLTFFTDPEIHAVIEQLSKAEVAHARVIFNALGKASAEHLDDFEATYASMKGDILEGGQPVEQVVDAARAMVASAGVPALLEFALELEHRSYDIYRTLADRTEGDLQNTFLDLAEQEKRHARSLLKRLDSWGKKAA